MNTIILVTHGPMAAALLKSAEIILGEALPDVQAVCLEPHDDLEAARARVLEALAHAEASRVRKGALVLVDLFGGTAANAAAWALQDRQFEVVAGVNLPMLLEVLLNRDSLPARELAALAVSTGKQGVADIGAALWRAPVAVPADAISMD